MDGGNEEPARPSWMPAVGVLPAVVPVGRFLLRGPGLGLAVTQLTVYPNGCEIELLMYSAAEHAPSWALGISETFEQMMFTARFGSQPAAVTGDDEPWQAWSRGEQRLALVRYGYEGTGHSGGEGTLTGRLWLHPLPPPEPGTLTVRAARLPAEPDACPLDGAAITAAAARAQLFWPS